MPAASGVGARVTTGCGVPDSTSPRTLLPTAVERQVLDARRGAEQGGIGFGRRRRGPSRRPRRRSPRSSRPQRRSRAIPAPVRIFTCGTPGEGRAPAVRVRPEWRRAGRSSARGHCAARCDRLRSKPSANQYASFDAPMGSRAPERARAPRPDAAAGARCRAAVPRSGRGPGRLRRGRDARRWGDRRDRVPHRRDGGRGRRRDGRLYPALARHQRGREPRERAGARRPVGHRARRLRRRRRPDGRPRPRPRREPRQPVRRLRVRQLVRE